MKRYTVTRTQAASLLWVSTRTIDRYVKSGRLSYKKIANKVILNEEELRILQNEFSSLRQEISTELIWDSEKKTISVKPVSDMATLLFNFPGKRQANRGKKQDYFYATAENMRIRSKDSNDDSSSWL